MTLSLCKLSDNIRLRGRRHINELYAANDDDWECLQLNMMSTNADDVNHSGDDELTQLRHFATSSRFRNSVVDDAIMLHNLQATIDDIQRNPERPVSEDVTPLDASYYSSPSSAHSSSSLPSASALPTYYCQSTGQPLDNKLVDIAMQEELEYMRNLPVWIEYANEQDLRHAHPHLDKHIINTRWVLVNKGDCVRPDVRARLVAQEIKTDRSISGHDPTLVSATPPLEAFRALISKAATNPHLVLGQIDIKKAHLYGEAKRKIAVRLPSQANHNLAFLLRTLYGTRDAASSWEAEVRKVMELFGLEIGKSCPCLYKNESTDVALLVHGDDIVFCGPQKEFDRLVAHLLKHWKLSVKGTLGRDGDKSHLRILGRLLSYRNSCFELEADPRHIELLRRLVESESGNTKSVKTPGIKAKLDDEFDSRKLNPSELSDFRSHVMRAAYLGLDRPELGYSIVQCARVMSSPCEGDWTMLKRVCRYLIDTPRLVQVFKYQKQPTELHVYCDADHAGDKKTRKSTTGIATMLGTHCLSTTCKTQSVIALSSGESEFYAMGSATSRAIGTKSMLADLGVYVKIIICTDSNAATGTAGRMGLGKAKHISTAYLWLQIAIRDGLVSTYKVDTKVQLADLMTKYLESPQMLKLLNLLGFHKRDGQHELALKAG